MVVLSARFALLACLCAAIPLVLPPVEAAHLYGHYPMEASSRSHDQTRGNSPSYDDKYHVHKAPDRRDLELPPLLRRYAIKKAEGHRGHVSHDRTYLKPPRSAFARSRYHPEPVSHSRRSSVYVPGEHGNTYLVSGTPPRTQGGARKDADKRSFHAHNLRQVDESNLVLGKIDIMGPAPSAGDTQRLASLIVDATPIDWRMGESPIKAFQLSASSANQTQFIMIPTVDSSNAEERFIKHVNLATEVFDASSTEMVMFCATYDPDPGSRSMFVMTPCTGANQPVTPVNDATIFCSDATNDASSSIPHQSQIFSYDPSSGKVEPISATAISPSVDDSSTDPPVCAAAKVRRDTGNSTTSGSTSRSSTSTSAAPTATPSQQAQNVTLVFVAGTFEVPASPNAANTTSQGGAGQVSLFRTTITTTIVSTITAPGPSNRIITPAQAAVSVSASSTPSPASQSTMTTTNPSVPTTASRSAASLSLPSSILGTATSKAPASPVKSLEVEIVGLTLSNTAHSSFTSSTSTSTSTSTTTSSSSSSTSPSLNAQVVASSLADEMVDSERRAFVSAAVMGT